MTSPHPTAPPIVAPPLPGPPAAREVVFDEAGRIAEDLPCLRCGYNLRGLGPEAACPECASAVGRSIQGDLLRFGDPDWLARLAKGLLLIIIGLLAGLVASLLVFVLLITLPASGGIAMGAVLVGGALLGVSTSLVVVIGVWWMTAPEPARTEGERPVTARTLARWCMTAALLSSPLEIMYLGGAGFATMGTPGMPRSNLMLLPMIWVIVGIVVIVGRLAGLVYLRRLALRIPRPDLAHQTQVVMWGYGCAAAAGIVFWIGMDVVSAAVSVGTAPVFGVTMTVAALGSCAIGVAALVFGVWGLVLLFRHRGALSRAEAEARATWTRK